MKQIIRPEQRQMPGGSGGKIWSILSIIGFILRLILKLTETEEPRSEWERRD